MDQAQHRAQTFTPASHSTPAQASAHSHPVTTSLDTSVTRHALLPVPWSKREGAMGVGTSHRLPAETHPPQVGLERGSQAPCGTARGMTAPAYRDGPRWPRVPVLTHTGVSCSEEPVTHSRGRAPRSGDPKPPVVGAPPAAAWPRLRTRYLPSCSWALHSA